MLRRAENAHQLAYFMSAENVKWRKPVQPRGHPGNRGGDDKDERENWKSKRDLQGARGKLSARQT